MVLRFESLRTRSSTLRYVTDSEGAMELWPTSRFWSSLSLVLIPPHVNDKQYGLVRLKERMNVNLGLFGVSVALVHTSNVNVESEDVRHTVTRLQARRSTPQRRHATVKPRTKQGTPIHRDAFPEESLWGPDLRALRCRPVRLFQFNCAMVCLPIRKPRSVGSIHDARCTVPVQGNGH